MIKAFLFDYGGVITAGEAGPEAVERLATNLHVTNDKAKALLGSIWYEYGKGAITEAELWSAIEADYGRPIAASQRTIWNGWEHTRPKPDMIELVRKLRYEGHVVGLLSNTIPNTAADIRKHGGYDIFDLVMLSCEVGLIKPDPEIYKLALRKLSVLPHQVVFTDDQECCIVPARELGMHTILARKPKQIADDIAAILASR